MDRNLGDNNPDSVTRRILNYQFGRKDPFPGKLAKYTKPYDDAKLAVRVTFGESVNTPTTYYSYDGDILETTDWCATITDPVHYKLEWNDVKTNNTDNVPSTVKSIFDPSPLGWQVPHIVAFDDFDFEGNLVWEKSPYAKRIYKGGKGFIIFPASGMREIGSGDVVLVGETSFIWGSGIVNFVRTLRIR